MLESRKRMRNSDVQWERFGKENAYYGVCSLPEYRRENLSAEQLNKFFGSGEAYINDVFRDIKQMSGRVLSPDRALDFGCGVGRLTIPIARRAQAVVGVDVSASMLHEAKKNTAAFSNVEFIQGDDDLSQLSGTFDFINSSLVFQHIPMHRGKKLFVLLLNRLRPGGFGAVQFPFQSNRAPILNFLNSQRRHSALLNGFVNLSKGRPFRDPHMQMNYYPLSWVFDTLYQNGCNRVFSRLDSDGSLSAFLIFERS